MLTIFSNISTIFSSTRLYSSSRKIITINIPKIIPQEKQIDIIENITFKGGCANNYPALKAVINKDDIKSFASGKPGDVISSEDTVEVNFAGLSADKLQLFNEGKSRIVIRLTFKDLPTRFRKWTESYEYVPKSDDTKDTIAEGIAAVINKQYKRARVSASASAGKLTLKALPYDDDNSVNTINVANKVRFNVNLYYTNTDATGFASNNKYFPTGVTVTKTAGKVYPAEAKLVRDREAQAMGYEGILNRGCCTWPIIKPEMRTKLDAKYSYATLEFENMYRAADDIQRHTK